MFRDDPLQAGDTQASSCRRGQGRGRLLIPPGSVRMSAPGTRGSFCTGFSPPPPPHSPVGGPGALKRSPSLGRPVQASKAREGGGWWSGRNGHHGPRGSSAFTPVPPPCQLRAAQPHSGQDRTPRLTPAPGRRQAACKTAGGSLACEARA